MKDRPQRILKSIALIIPLILMLVLSYIVMEGSALRRTAVLFLLIIGVLLSIGYLKLYGRQVKWNQLLFTALMLSVEAMIAFTMGDNWYLFMPLLVGVMLIAIVVDEQLAMLLHVMIVLIVALTLGQGSIFIIYYIMVGSIGAMSVRYARIRKNMLIVVGVLAVFSGAVYWLLNFAIIGTFDWINLLFSMGSTALAVVIVLGSLPLWESIFQVMTPLKLLDYTDTNHPLLQLLLEKAPGTYHHVLMVANLSERAARAIDANALLAKAGALFHDIGKLKKPSYFIENQNGGQNPHDEIAAEDSAGIILEHVSHGIRLATENKLPKPIIAIIKQHHGTTLQKYFYHKAQNYNDGVTYEEKKFRYGGPKPQSKEAAVVMLADCVEAFVRSLSEKDRNMEKIEWIVGEITRQKFEDGQLDLSDLQIKELKEIEQAFIQVYTGLYHERISYPEEGDLK